MNYFINGKVNKVDAVHSLVGGQISSIDEKFTFHDGQIPPSEAEIDAEVERLQAEYDAQEYARNRADDYPSTGDQLDMMYKDTKNSTTTHADAVEAVKTKWPKDNSGPVE